MVPSQEYLRLRFDYDVESGNLIWKEMLSLNQKELDALDAYDEYGTFERAALALGINVGTLQTRVRSANKYRESGRDLPLHIGKRLPKTLVGQVAGRVTNGYVVVVLDYNHYLAHTLVWMREYGQWLEEIDHQDLDGTNNRLSNLRPATRSQNNMNQSARIDNKSGYKGVHLRQDTGKYSAEIKANGRKYALGSYDTAEEACAVRRGAAKILHADFARDQ